MKTISIQRAKLLTMAALTMTSCGFVLWLDQGQGSANDQQPVVVTTQTATPTTTVSKGQSNPLAPLNQSPQMASQESQPQQPTASVNQNDHGNYAFLDQQHLNNQGQLTVSGWHATNASAGKDYHYIIAYDPTVHREISRQLVSGTTAVVVRPDVQQVHNVAGAAESGFKVTFDLNKDLATTGAIQIISRYSSDPLGNNNAVDYWFAPIVINRNNYANLDQAVANNGKLQLSGWQASNLAVKMPYRYVIVIDRTTGREVARQQITTNISRPDVAKAYPDVANADRSGFAVSFTLSQFNFNHQLQVLTRYSSAKDGNNNYLDYWFPPITSDHPANQGFLDRLDWSNPSNVTVSGWHANDASQFEKQHYLILFDQTTKQQVAVTTATTVQRTDVAKAFPTIKTADQAGFNGHFDLTLAPLIGGHRYSIVSRYSTSTQGNGGTESFTDFWSVPITMNQHASYLDRVVMTTKGLQISGWMASDYSANHPYAYAIVTNDGHEITRQQLTLTDRTDVAKAVSNVYNSKHSGFNTLLVLEPARITGNMRIVLRFSAAKDGNGHYDDQWSKNYPGNQGFFDQASFDGTTVHLNGWHASNQSAADKYQWIIAVDQNGEELGRWQVQNANLQRADAGQAVSAVLNSGQSGFNLTFNVTDNMQHKVIRLIDRLTDDPQGNGHYVDLYSNSVSINSGAQTSGLKTVYYDAMGRIIGAFNNAEVIGQNPELPTGCEMTAVTMMLCYAGANISKIQVANETPRSANGDYGFVGNPYSPSGWWVFPTGIAPVVQNHLGTSQVMTGASLAALQNKLTIGHLVVVWMANMNGFVNHAITLTGYNTNGFFYNNPWTGQKESMSYGDFYGHWNADAQRALSY